MVEIISGSRVWNYVGNADYWLASRKRHVRPLQRPVNIGVAGVDSDDS